MKRIIACIAALAVMTALTACGNDSSSASRVKKETSAAAETTSEETASETEPEVTENTADSNEESAADDTADEEYVITDDVLSTKAAAKMKSLNTLLSLFSGGIAYDDMDTIESDGKTFAKVTDLAGYSSLDELKFSLYQTCTGSVRDNILSEIDANLIDKDGTLYVHSVPRGYYIFRTDSGVTISDRTDDLSFTATTVEHDDIYGVGTAHFVNEEADFLIDSYEFK